MPERGRIGKLPRQDRTRQGATRNKHETSGKAQSNARHDRPTFIAKLSRALANPRNRTVARDVGVLVLAAADARPDVERLVIDALGLVEQSDGVVVPMPEQKVLALGQQARIVREQQLRQRVGVGEQRPLRLGARQRRRHALCVRKERRRTKEKN